MNGLSLFSGAGIGELALKHIIPNYRTVGYVEWETYCQEAIRARIRDGVLDDAPIFGDIRQFNSRYASLFAGKVDWVSGGFPCQPFSHAGKRQADADGKNMWPPTAECLRIIKPKYAFLENVRGLLTADGQVEGWNLGDGSGGYFPYIHTIFRDLADIGYNAEWDVVSASDVGAPHQRERLWILAYSQCTTGNRISNEADKYYKKCNNEWSSINLCEMVDIAEYRTPQVPVDWGTDDGLASGLDRLKAIGNGWVPQVLKSILRVGD